MEENVKDVNLEENKEVKKMVESYKPQSVEEKEETKTNNDFPDLDIDDVEEDNYSEPLFEDVEIVSADTVEEKLTSKMNNDLIKSIEEMSSGFSGSASKKDKSNEKESKVNINGNKEDRLNHLLDEDDNLEYNDKELEKLLDDAESDGLDDMLSHEKFLQDLKNSLNKNKTEATQEPVKEEKTIQQLLEEDDTENDEVEESEDDEDVEEEYKPTSKRDKPLDLDALLKKYDISNDLSKKYNSKEDKKEDSIDFDFDKIINNDNLTTAEKDESLAQNYEKKFGKEELSNLNQLENDKNNKTAQNVFASDDFDLSAVQQVVGNEKSKPKIALFKKKSTDNKTLLANKSKPYFIFLSVLVGLALVLGAVVLLDLFDVIDLSKLFN